MHYCERLPVTRRKLILAAGGLLAAAIQLSCRSNAENDTVTATANPSATATPIPAIPTLASPDPTVSMTNSVDGAQVAIVVEDELNASGHYDEVRVSEEGVRHLIPLDSIDWGRVARDGIPALDNPDYVGPDRWAQMVYDPEGLVIGVEVNGKRRAFPLQILIWHEIVNETFDGKHLLVTY